MAATEEVLMDSKVARLELFRGFRGAFSDYQAVLRELMQKALDAPEDVLSPGERMGFGTTGSSKVVGQLQALEERLNESIGQPIVSFGAAETGTMALISGRPIAGLGRYGINNYLQVPVAYKTRWSPQGYSKAEFEPNPTLAVAKVELFDQPGDDGSIRYTFTDLVETGLVLIGDGEVFRASSQQPDSYSTAVRHLIQISAQEQNA